MAASAQPLIRLFLVMENRILRDALGRLFRKRSDFQIIGRAGKQDIAPQQVLGSQCDVVICDFFDPKWIPLPLLWQRPRRIKVILIDMQDDNRQFLEAVKTGVVGYLLKDASTSDVIVAVSAAFKGEAICPPRLCTTLFQWVAQSAGCEGTLKVPQCPDLTIRQRQLIDLVAQGLTNKEIANHLNLSEFTVRNHIHRILKLVHVETRREAAEIIHMGKDSPTSSGARRTRETTSALI